MELRTTCTPLILHGMEEARHDDHFDSGIEFVTSRLFASMDFLVLYCKPKSESTPPVAPVNETARRAQRKMRRPSELAIAAYRLWFATQRPQEEIAKVLSREHGATIRQNQVSRMLKQVEKYVRAGNVLPDLPKPARRAVAIDPAKLDMGAREDQLTQRQRTRRSDDD
jgi:hypothetical protein